MEIKDEPYSNNVYSPKDQRQDKAQTSEKDSIKKKTRKTPQNRFHIRKGKEKNEPSPSSNIVKKVSAKTSKNDKDTQKSQGSRDEDDDKVAGKQEKRKRGEKKKNPKRKYYEGETAKQKLQKHRWDGMMDTREKERMEVNSDHYWDRVEVITKIIVCIFVSTFVLATAVISKLCVILITSNILPPMNDTDSYWWHKTAGSSLTFTNQKTNVQWIWALMLIISAPYIFTIMGSGWQLLLGRTKWESAWKGFPQVMIRETLHSTGICMMAFVLLPSVDPIAGILVCFHVATIPGLLGFAQCFYRKSCPWLSIVLRTIALLLQLAGIGFACGYYFLETKTETRMLQKITICFSPIFISTSWLENYFSFIKEKTCKEPKGGTQNTAHETRSHAQSDVEMKVNSSGYLMDLLGLKNERKVNFEILVIFGK